MPDDLAQQIAALSDPDPAKRSGAAEELSRLGPDAREAAVPLARTCADEVEEVREWAVAALEELGPPRPVDCDPLSDLLTHPSPDVGYWAATLLGRLKDEASGAAPTLADALGAPLDLSVRQRAAWALGQIGPPAAAALGALKQAERAADPRQARQARQAIERISG